MTPDEEERRARSRYMLISACHLGGTVIALFGLVIWQGNLLRPGGWPALGIGLFVIGAIEALLVPKLLARRWRSPPGP